MDVREAIQTRPMRPYQLRIVLMWILITMIDGYEVLVMAFVAPRLAEAWTLNAVEVGYLLSAGIFGMAVGATLISPMADTLGRRRHILICLALITLGTARGAEVGLMIGIGREVAIVAPILTGYLLKAGWTPQGMYHLFAGFFVGASLSVFLLDRTYRGRSENPDEPKINLSPVTAGR